MLTERSDTEVAGLSAKNSFPIFTIFLFIISANTIFAQVIKTTSDNKDEEKIVTVPSGEVIDEDYFGFGDTVEIHGTVNGDVYAAGRQVIIEGKVNGDLIVAAGTINIPGEVTQDARIAGGKIAVTGNILRNLTVAGGSVDLAGPGKIGGSIIAFGGDVNISAPVGGNIKVSAGDLLISNRIDGDVDASAGNIRITSKTVISGDLTYRSDGKASIDPDAVISGNVNMKEGGEFSSVSPEQVSVAFFGGYLLSALINFVSTLIIGLLLVYFYPGFMTRTVSIIRERALHSLGLGFIALFLTPIAAFILMITILGIPFALLLLAVYFVYIYMARVFVIYWIGSSVFNRSGKSADSVWQLLVGLVIYTVLTLIPFIGGLITFFTILIGLGVLLIAKKQYYTILREQGRI